MRPPVFARAAVVTAGILLAPSVAPAHVTVWPRESQAGASERYVVRVPTEGQVTTIAVELEIPPDVTVSGVLAGAGFVYEARRDGNRITAITWKQAIKPSEVGEFVFFARNPKAGQIAWKARQRFADGTSADWVGVEGDRRPASVTHLKAP
ncbi:MAG: hypothetical protein A3F70_00840 [Acidobacteria bacterium RIFCSPLOWO2_12_FULL_67_14]|nr:MAG: hypothetical protein A3H29_11680 [Acidobacteria bacterium RIFCSPLOWO2_02_FULL_67_21]OFW41734.1 MAG: hypothetical protein A3F70_00840 [Acidobacteria bacterium RIFCSPLOWO2_12_FULL_67_14]